MPLGFAYFELEIIGETKKNGTIIEFFPDGSIMEVVEFDKDVLTRRFKEMAYLNQNLTIDFIDERCDFRESYHFGDWLMQFIQDIKQTPSYRLDNLFQSTDQDTEMEVALVYNEGFDENVLSFVNNSARQMEEHMKRALGQGLVV